MASITVELHIPKMGGNIPNMGMSTTPVRRLRDHSTVEVLFSTTRQRPLGLLFDRPARGFLATQLIAMVASNGWPRA